MNPQPPFALWANRKSWRALGLSLLLAAGSRGSPEASPPEATRVTLGGEQVFDVGFNKLASFSYTIVDEATGASPEQIAAARKRDQIPAWLRFYQDKRVALTGFLLPLQLQDGLAKKFVLMKDVNTCCYGAVPGMNDYVVVTMSGDGASPAQDIPVVVIGKLHIEEKYENGLVVSLFELAGDKYLGPAK